MNSKLFLFNRFVLKRANLFSNKSNKAMLVQFNSNKYHTINNHIKQIVVTNNNDCDLSKCQINKQILSSIHSNFVIPSKSFKGDKKKSKKDESSDDEDDDDSLQSKDSHLTRDSKLVTANVITMRADAIYKAIQKTSRSKIDLMFYEGRLRVNGKLLMKKSTHINAGDEMDVVKDLSKQNPEFLSISRIEILSVKGYDDEIEVKARYYKNLLVENYAENPWSPDMKIKDEEADKKSK